MDGVDTKEGLYQLPFPVLVNFLPKPFQPTNIPVRFLADVMDVVDDDYAEQEKCDISKTANNYIGFLITIRGGIKV